MAPEVPLLPCVGCGTHVPRTEMFGHGADLRCGDCAASLRDRLHPSNVRRSPMRAELRMGPPRVTAGLVGLIAVIWVAFQIDATSQALESAFFLFLRTTSAEGLASWRILDAWQPFAWALIHTDLAHVVLNAFALYQAGRLIEMGWGGRQLLFVALGAGTFGTAAGWLVNGAPTIGISGGVFGLYGFLIALRRHHALAAAVVSRVFIHSLLASTVLLVILTELGGMRISHVAHAAGFLFGTLAGMAMRGPARLPLLALLGALVVGLCLAAPHLDPLGWDTRLFGRG